MFCNGCGTQSADSDVLCGGCGVPKQHAADGVTPPAKAVFNLGAAMRRQAPNNVKRRRWRATTCAAIALVVLCVIIAAT